MSMLLYVSTTWTLTKIIKKKLDSNCTKMLWAILNKSWRQHPTKQLYGHIPPISKTIQIRWTRHLGHCRRSKDELFSDVLWLTPSHKQGSVRSPARTYLIQLCIDTGCSREVLAEAMDDRDKWQKRVREICACGMTYIDINNTGYSICIYL